MNENQLLKTMESTGITTWSFDEINLALDNLLEKYKGKVYTEEKSEKNTRKSALLRIMQSKTKSKH